MKTKSLLPFLPALAWLALSAAPLLAGLKEASTIVSAGEVLDALTAVPLKGIPAALLRDA